MSVIGLSKERLAIEANRLRNDDILNEAFIAVRNDALEALSRADADDKTMIVRLQQKVAVIEDVQSALHGFVIQGGRFATGEPE